MKYLQPLLLSLFFSSCLATTGDLAGLSSQFTDTLTALDNQVQSNLAIGADSTAAFETALLELQSAVDGTVSTIDGRVGELATTVALVAQKTSEGPQGWLELLAALSASVAAGGVVLNKHRNLTRAKVLGELKA